MVRSEVSPSVTAAAALCHTGYFARYKIFRDTLRAFHDAYNGVCQVIALGGGLDTTYFDLAVSFEHCGKKNLPQQACTPLQTQGMRCAFFLDVDLPSISHYKAGVIDASSKMQAVMSTAVGGDAGSTITVGDAHSGGTVLAADYALVSCDLADLDAVQKLLKHPGLNPRCAPHLCSAR